MQSGEIPSGATNVPDCTDAYPGYETEKRRVDGALSIHQLRGTMVDEKASSTLPGWITRN
jgi:hypothetical protein